MADKVEEQTLVPAYHFSPDDVVILIVGPAKQKMLVHAPQITAHYEFFAAALKKEWIEGQTREISSPEEEPEVVAYYIEHVYFNKLPTDIYTKSSPGLDKEAGYQTLAQLYVLAERLLDCICRSQILREFLRLGALECKAGDTYGPNNIPVNIIYGGTTPDSPARRLLVDIHASSANEDWYPNDLDVGPAFLIDLVRKLLHNLGTLDTSKNSRRPCINAEDYRV